MIDKSPKLLKKITLNHILSALNCICQNEVQMVDKRESRLVKKSWKLKNGLFCFDKTITSFSLIVDGKRERHYFFNEYYSEFYKKNKYSLNDSSKEMEQFLTNWQEKESKNFKKDISKIVDQFERTHSVQISVRLLKALPKLSFGDTETFSSPIELSQISASLKEEEKQNKRNELNQAIALVKNLKSSLFKAEERLATLKKEKK